MNHQVEDDVDIGAASFERREPVALDETYAAKLVARRKQRWIESLDVADLQLDVLRVGKLGELAGLAARRCQRLLDEHVDSAFDQ